jgi:hypothetical protein
MFVTSVGLSVAPDNAESIWLAAASAIVSEAAVESKAYFNNKRRMQSGKIDCMSLVPFTCIVWL